MIIIPAVVLVWVIVVLAGGPTQFVSALNDELINISNVMTNWVNTWF